MSDRSVTISRIGLALAATWLGWGFDVFDAHLFNYIAPPTLSALHVEPGAVDSNMAWIMSIFLVGWGAGGMLFGRLADRLGRSNVLLLTMLLYGGGTAACAACSTVPTFVACRVVASLGIGGEWAAGASLLAEVSPDRWRPLLGAVMYTASPLAQVAASFVNHRIVEGRFASDPLNGWRYAFLIGLVPVAVAFLMRLVVAEPARWKEHANERVPVSALFGKDLRRATLIGLLLATVALVGAWGVLGFLPKAIREWCEAVQMGHDQLAATVDRGNQLTLLGAVTGVLATVPITMLLGRRFAFLLYFSTAAVASWVVLGADLPLEERLHVLPVLGFGAHGVFGIFPYYLPELFPTSIRGTGAGFCYSFGRFASAAGILVLGGFTQRLGLTRAMLVIAVVYVIGVLGVPFARDTRGKLAG